MIDDETREDIFTGLELMFDAGYESLDEIRVRSLASMSGVVDAESGGDAELARIVERFVGEQSAHKELDERSWPQTTDCDRLDAALLALAQEGVASCGYYGWDQSEAADLLHACIVKAKSQGITAHGYVYFTEQDVERVVQEGVLLLAFGNVAWPEGNLEPDASVGAEASAAIQAAGLKVTWDCDVTQRICVHMDWKRRLGTSPAGRSPLVC